MAARDGMANIIQDVRILCNAGTADHAAGGTTLWSDAQLQTVLDEYQSLHKYLALTPSPVYVDGTALYYDYLAPKKIGWMEEGGAGGTANANSGFSITDSAGGTAPSYSVNYRANTVRFAADTQGTAYYLNCRSYDVYRACAAIMERKAAIVSLNVDWSSDNHRFAASQEANAYREQAARFYSMAGMEVSMMQREDEW